MISNSQSLNNLDVGIITQAKYSENIFPIKLKLDSKVEEILKSPEIKEISPHK